MSFRGLFLLYILFWIQSISTVAAQIDSTDSDSGFSVLNLNANVIENAESLNEFYRQLELLKTGKGEKITILHIGDSHIQGDYFSGSIRLGLQGYFGSAGRGLVFPYALAKTYSPPDLTASSNTAWTTKRNFFFEDTVPLGITGYAIVCNQDDFMLRMGVKNPGMADNSFNKVCVLHGNDSSCYDLGIYREENGGAGLKELGVIPCWDGSESRWGQHTVNIDTRVNELVIKPVKNNGIQNQARIYGFVFHTDDKGILYNTAGVGAAQLVNFTRTTAFLDQAAALEPDLIIFSLGTNESYSKWFDTTGYQNLIESVVTELRRRSPKSAFIFTTPPDIVYKHHYPKYMDPVCRAIKRASVSAGFAVWDLNTVMGGPGSMHQWHANQLAQNDLIHFRAGGYNLQAQLFLDAFIKGYNVRAKSPLDISKLESEIELTAPVFKKQAVVLAAPSNSLKYHTVRSGETLSGIAEKHGTTVSRICSLNGISRSKVIRPGQRLRVK